MPFKQFILLVLVNAAATVLALLIVDKFFNPSRNLAEYITK